MGGGGGSPFLVLWALSFLGFGGRWLGVGGVSFWWVAPGAGPRHQKGGPPAPLVVLSCRGSGLRSGLRSWSVAVRRVAVVRARRRCRCGACGSLVGGGWRFFLVGGAWCGAAGRACPAPRRLGSSLGSSLESSVVRSSLWVSCLPWVCSVCAAFRRLGVFWHLGVRGCGGWRAVRL